MFSVSAGLGAIFVNSIAIYGCASGIVMSSCVSSDVLSPYTCEAYSTRIRGLSIGFHSTISRVFTIFAPLTMVPIIEFSHAFFFGYLCTLGVISILIGFLLPADKKDYKFDK